LRNRRESQHPDKGTKGEDNQYRVSPIMFLHNRAKANGPGKLQRAEGVA
jgi:hypothetical protein